MKIRRISILLLLVLVISSIQASLVSSENTKPNGDNSDDYHVSPYSITPDQTDPMGVVVIDDMHSNDYTGDSMNKVIEDLEMQGYVALYSSEFNTFEDAVSGANYLVITAPFDSIPSDEVQAITTWMQEGANNLIIASRGDFSEPEYDSLNNILSGIEATSRVQDDNVYTTAEDVPQPWYINSDNFNSGDFPGIFDGVSPISFFSPSSVNPGENGQLLVNAQEKAYQSNENGAAPAKVYDNTDDGSGGDSIPLAVYEEINQGDYSDRVVTIGTTLWADFDFRTPNFGDVTFFSNILSYMRNETLSELGEIPLNVPDEAAPDVDFVFPHDNAYVSDTVEIQIELFDAFGVTSHKISINGEIVAENEMTYTWDTSELDQGIYTVTATAEDAAGNVGSTTVTYNVVHNFEPFLEEDPKIMTYNIQESGIFDEWKDVMLEENADIIALVETGDFDDNNNQLLNTYISDFNNYFFDEIGYKAYTLQNIDSSFNGITILSRYDISSSQKLDSLTDDSGSNVPIPLPFLHSVLDINGQEVNVIGAHLTCCSGESNWNAREKQQESIINYMDALGDEPIIYMGDMNSVSPEDVDPSDQEMREDLGTEPIEMIIDSSHPKASEVHEFYDVAVVTNTKSNTYIGSDQSRIDYIFVNQHLKDNIISSTTGDTESAKFGSDHLSVDSIIDISSYLTEPTYDLTEVSDYQTSEIGPVYILPVLFGLFIIRYLMMKRKSK